ncbi:unnamed protein product [Linum tenue]|uniref:Uncharacterized protein n=1 Tax=Linum tenue TaxID=586396 RepID=A0AAV0KWK9_9ROSI|nr:unnamed protein product [Linum tenue]
MAWSSSLFPTGLSPTKSPRSPEVLVLLSRVCPSSRSRFLTG